MLLQSEMRSRAVFHGSYIHKAKTVVLIWTVLALQTWCMSEVVNSGSVYGLPRYSHIPKVDVFLATKTVTIRSPH